MMNAMALAARLSANAPPYFLRRTSRASISDKLLSTSELLQVVQRECAIHTVCEVVCGVDMTMKVAPEEIQALLLLLLPKERALVRFWGRFFFGGMVDGKKMY